MKLDLENILAVNGIRELVLTPYLLELGSA